MYIKIDLLGNQLPDTADNWAAVLDANTNLMWEVNFSHQKYKWLDINQRAAEVNQVGLCGHRDWRVPNIDELKSLVKKGEKYPSIDTEYFPNADDLYFWSLSSNADDPDYAQLVNFRYSYSGNYLKSYAEHVRLVRGSATAQP